MSPRRTWARSAIREAVRARRASRPRDVGDVIMGCVLQAGAGMNVARQAALKAGLPVEVPAETVNRVCGSGLQAVVHAVEAIRVGYVDTVVAGGTESMSNAPYLLKGARWGYRMGHAEAIDSMLPRGSRARSTRAIWGSPPRRSRRGTASRARIRTRSRPRASGARRGRWRRQLRRGDRAGRGAAEEGRAAADRRRRIPARRTPRSRSSRRCVPPSRRTASVTAGNASGINDGAAALVVATAARESRRSAPHRWRGSSRTPPPESTR